MPLELLLEVSELTLQLSNTSLGLMVAFNRYLLS